MEDFMIKETFKLPSLGKVYNVDIPEDIELRSMTINEEMMRLGNSGTWKSIADVIDACILTKLPISTYDMCTADFTFLWHRLRVVTYGASYPIDCTCTFCNARNSFNIDLLKLPITYYDSAEYNKYKSFELPISKKQITIEIQTPRMLDIIESKVRSQKEKTGNGSKILATLQTSISLVDNKKIDASEKEILLRTLPMQDINKIIVATDNLNNCFGLGITVEAECENCHETFLTMFQQGKEFFRPTTNFEW